MERVLLKLGTALLLPGVVLLGAYFASGVDFDDQGVLREQFYLLGLGAPLFGLGLIFVGGVGAVRLVFLAQATLEEELGRKDRFR